jgi:hypothetical protein
MQRWDLQARTLIRCGTYVELQGDNFIQSIGRGHTVTGARAQELTNTILHIYNIIYKTDEIRQKIHAVITQLLFDTTRKLIRPHNFIHQMQRK